MSVIAISLWLLLVLVLLITHEFKLLINVSNIILNTIKHIINDHTSVENGVSKA